MAAVVSLAASHPTGAHERISAAVAECAKLGITVAPPDVNRSQANFALESREDGGETIRFGLQQIKNVGSGAAESIVEERERNDPFASIEDFCRRADFKTINKRAMEAIIKSGALAAFGDRGTHLANLDRLVALAQREQRLKESGQATMFDLFGDEVATPMPALELESMPVARSEELAWEKELLGVYVSEHPFKAAAAVLAPAVTTTSAELAAEGPQTQPSNEDGDTAVSAAPAPLPRQGREATLAGMVGNTRRLYTRDGRPFCAAEIEDLSGTVEVTVWPELFQSTQDLWLEGNIVVMQVRVKERNGRLQISVEQVELYQAADGLPIGFVPPDWLTKRKGARNGEPGNGALGSAGEPETENREPSAVGNGSDETQPVACEDPTGVGEQAAAGAEQAAVATAVRASLRIDLRETEDEDADRDRLQLMMAALRDFPGEDRVRLTVRTLEGASQTVALPSVRACPELTAHLAEVLSDAGEARVVEAD
jgi:DNA polymerase-3 subunit alpha